MVYEKTLKFDHLAGVRGGRYQYGFFPVWYHYEDMDINSVAQEERIAAPEIVLIQDAVDSEGNPLNAYVLPIAKLFKIPANDVYRYSEILRTDKSEKSAHLFDPPSLITTATTDIQNNEIVSTDYNNYPFAAQIGFDYASFSNNTTEIVTDIPLNQKYTPSIGTLGDAIETNMPYHFVPVTNLDTIFGNEKPSITYNYKNQTLTSYGSEGHTSYTVKLQDNSEYDLTRISLIDEKKVLFSVPSFDNKKIGLLIPQLGLICELIEQAQPSTSTPDSNTLATKIDKDFQAKAGSLNILYNTFGGDEYLLLYNNQNHVIKYFHYQLTNSQVLVFTPYRETLIKDARDKFFVKPLLNFERETMLFTLEISELGIKIAYSDNTESSLICIQFDQSYFLLKLNYENQTGQLHVAPSGATGTPTVYIIIESEPEPDIMEVDGVEPGEEPASPIQKYTQFMTKFQISPTDRLINPLDDLTPIKRFYVENSVFGTSSHESIDLRPQDQRPETPETPLPPPPKEDDTEEIRLFVEPGQYIKTLLTEEYISENQSQQEKNFALTFNENQLRSGILDEDARTMLRRELKIHTEMTNIIPPFVAFYGANLTPEVVEILTTDLFQFNYEMLKIQPTYTFIPTFNTTIYPDYLKLVWGIRLAHESDLVTDYVENSMYETADPPELPEEPSDRDREKYQLNTTFRLLHRYIKDGMEVKGQTFENLDPLVIGIVLSLEGIARNLSNFLKTSFNKLNPDQPDEPTVPL